MKTIFEVQGRIVKAYLLSFSKTLKRFNSRNRKNKEKRINTTSTIAAVILTLT